ncbi:MAG: NAD-dependent DNA ligase LigA [bacterium]
MKKLSQKEIDAFSVPELEKEIRHHNKLYFEDQKPEISDYDFDRLVERLKKMKPDSKVLFEIGSDIRKGVVVPKIAHTSPMLSLDKCYKLEDLVDWAGKFEGDVVVSPKIDGAAVEIRYDEHGKLALAATRGDGVKGEDISANVHFVPDIPKKVSEPGIEVRGEVYMPLSVFKTFQEEFANPRNLAAGAIKQKQPKKTGEYRLSFFAYDVRGKEFEEEIEKIRFLQKMGFKTVETRVLKKDEETLQKPWDRFLGERDKLDYEIDGVVYKANSLSEQERLGSSAHHPRWAIAYKFQGDSGVTTLREVEWSVARTGVITPIGIVDPVELSGAQVKHVSLHNFGILQKLGVTIPAKVAMVRAGGVIPYLEKVLEKQGKPVKVPEKCPSCGHPTEIRDDFLYCTNVKNCRAAKMSELEHFLKTVEIDGFGGVLIEKLHDSGLVEDPADFYTLTKEDLLSFERMGEILATKLIGNIQGKREMPLEVFLQSLGIRELARHSSKILVKEFGSLKKIFEATEEELSAIHTIGPVIAREVNDGLRKKRPLIDKLLKYVKVSESPVEKKGPLTGKSFLFTGKLAAMERSEAEKLVEKDGGEVASGVTKDLNYLVIGSEGYKNREKGNKWVKAEKLIEKGAALRVISEEEFLKMVSPS